MNTATKRYQLAFGLLLATLLLSYALVSRVEAQSAQFTQSMDFGSQGSQVAALQTFLSTKTAHYPEGLITGYFGPLTQAAVQRFQCAEEIVCSGSAATTGYGRVGPITLAQLNLRASGTIGVDVSAPFISGIVVVTSSTTATVSFSTNELSSSKVIYSVFPMTIAESAGPGFAPVVNGTTAMSDANFRTAHSISLSGLSPNTTYAYTAYATDGTGNLSLTWPAMFKTTL